MSTNKYDEAKHTSVNNNPCIKEHNLSLKCLDRNNYDNDACILYFDNYKNCKKFWGEIQVTRRKQGIQPALPVLEEREKIKEEYLKSMKK